MNYDPPNENMNETREHRTMEAEAAQSPMGAYYEIPLENLTPLTQVQRRQLPMVPPTPFAADDRLSQMLIDENVSILNTPSERRTLPETPMDRELRRRSSSLPNISRQELTETPVRPVPNVLQGMAINQPIVSHRAIAEHNRQARGVRERTTATPNVAPHPTRAKGPTQKRSILKDALGNPDYKETAYLDARSYAETLSEESELDKTLKSYLLGEGTLSEVTKNMASEVNKVKPQRKRKGPWMQNRRDNRNTRKAKIYQFTQKAYDHNKKATITKIINGTFSLNNNEQVFPDIDKVEKVYEERLEKGNQTDNTRIQIPDEVHSDEYGAFTEDEVKEVIKQLKKSTAAGIDNVRTPDVRRIPTGHITALMNYWWGWFLPEELEQCRTTLLPKKDHGLEDVGHWRPITVGNLLIRIYAKLWDKRIRKNVTLDERQKGFVPVNGCYENVKILQEIIKSQRRKRKEYNLVFIDLAKAFDTVSHKSIEKGLRRKGIPSQVIKTILDMYGKATTTITVGGKSTRKLKINAGVKQGCPLSPLLFNLIIDELIEELKETNIGIEIRGTLVGCMGFADDLVLIAEERVHMQILLEKCKTFFENKGLKANAGKCASLRVVPAVGKKNLKVITATHRWWGQDKIPSITFKDLVKYLGVELSPEGLVRLPRKQWATYFENLRAAHLNPIQKVDAIRQILVAKMQYQLRLSDHGLEEARKLNRLVRKNVKLILHLPTWTLTAWIHHRSGGNIPDLVTSTMVSRAKASSKMKVSSDPAARATAEKQNPIDESRVARLNLGSTNRKEAQQRKCEEELARVNNGRALLTALKSDHRRNWVWTKKGLTPGNKIRLLQSLSGTLPTKLNKTRGINQRELKVCKQCRLGEIEDDAHILSRCPLNKDLITKRHDYLANKIAKELSKNPTRKVWRERSWRLGTALLRPDITMIEGDKAFIIELTIPYETSEAYLLSRMDDKRAKYQPLLNELEQVGCTSAEIIPIVVGSLGTITRDSKQILKQLKLRDQMDAIQMTTITGSINILNNHFRRNDFTRHKINKKNSKYKQLSTNN